MHLPVHSPNGPSWTGLNQEARAASGCPCFQGPSDVAHWLLLSQAQQQGLGRKGRTQDCSKQAAFAGTTFTSVPKCQRCD